MPSDESTAASRPIEDVRILVDADACPVKDEVYRVATRYRLEVVLVAASGMRIPADARIRLEIIAQGFDAADDWIVAHLRPDDIVITADVPLAARSLAAGAHVIGTTGRRFTEDNIGDAMATRGLLSDLRGAGERTPGPAPFGARDRSRFLGTLDEVIRSARARRSR